MFGRSRMSRFLAQRLYRQEWQSGNKPEAFWGTFRSFDEASAALPPGLSSYDQEEMLGYPLYMNPDGTVPPMPETELPVLERLRPIIASGARSVFDLGGYIGHVFYQYDAALSLPADLQWKVCDVSTIVRRGAEIAARKGEPRLRFTTDQAEVDGADILLAAGSLQYLREDALSSVLAACRAAPRHLIIHRTPFHPRSTVVTIQAVRGAGEAVSFCPYVVAARGPFLARLAELGYEVAADWSKDRIFAVPFHPETLVESYSGFHLIQRR